MLFNIGNIMGGKFAWPVAYSGIFPAGLILGTHTYSAIRRDGTSSLRTRSLVGTTNAIFLRLH
jgi:hypothetical protein